MFLFYKIIFVIIVLPLVALQYFAVRILHTGDIHGHYEKAGLIAAFVKEYKNNIKSDLQLDADNIFTHGKEKYTLYLDAGDIFTGSPYFTVGGPRLAASVMKILNPDAVALGDHEFDRNISGLKEYLANVGQEILCCNCDLSKEPDLEKYIRPSKILTFPKTKIGVIGYINSGCRTGENFGEVQFENEKASITKEVEKLKKAGTRMIILLGHGGYDLDKRIAKETRNIDLIVGGHSHTFLRPKNSSLPKISSGDYPTVVKNLDGTKVPIVHAYCNGRYVGKISMLYRDTGVLQQWVEALYDVTEQGLASDTEINKLLSKYNKEIAGKTTVKLSNAACTRYECALGNLVADSLIDYNLRNFHQKQRAKVWSNIGIAFVNGGLLRTGLTPEKRGNISVGNLMDCLPLANQIVHVQMKGKTLREVLEHSISWSGATTKSEFLQYSGIQVVYNYSKPVGQRVVSARVRCSECLNPEYEVLDESKSYVALTTDFLANGGDGYKVLRDKAKIINKFPEADLEIVRRYIKLKKIIQPQKEDRIVILNDDRPKSSDSDSICIANLYLILFLIIDTIVNRILL